MNECIIKIGEDFSRVPAGRYLSDGPNSGQRFRDQLLVPALETNENVIVDLSGTLGYGSSFLEEAFGGLVRLNKYSREDLSLRLKIIATDPRKGCYISRIKTYMDEAWNVV